MQRNYRGKRVIASVLTFSLAFSPLTPVSYVLADDASDQQVVELTGDSSQDTQTNDETVAAADGQMTVVGVSEDAASADEAQTTDQTVELGGAEATDAPAADGIEAVAAADAAKAEAKADAAATAAEAKSDAPAKQTATSPKVSEGNTGKGCCFMDADGTDKTVEGYESFAARQSDTLGGDDAWYVVLGDVTANKRIKVSGDVKLIVPLSSTLTLKRGIVVQENASLTIYGQSDQGGVINAESHDDQHAAIDVEGNASLTINGATVHAKSDTVDAAGIGGGIFERVGDITINNGTVTAESKKNGAGIGSGLNGLVSTITINGGDVTATAKGGDGAGIGGGEGASCGIVTINGGTVRATGSSHGAGIGGGKNERGRQITINGGAITARGGDYAAGIGAGGDGGAEQIKITGGEVNAWGGKESAGIGSANKGHVDTIEITGGNVKAVGADKAAGIGGGDGHEKNGTYGTITISGADTKVYGFGGNEAAGIGTGNDAKANNGTINIKDGAYVEAVGCVRDEVRIEGDKVYCQHGKDSSYMSGMSYDVYRFLEDSGAGIGGGDLTSGGTINISGEGTVVKAWGGENAAGIGSGDKAGSVGEINITGGDVYARGGGFEPLESNDTYRGADGAGMGGGSRCGANGSGKINISGAHTKVDAIGGSHAAGIGSGEESGIEEIHISGGAEVLAQGGDNAAGIGTGDCTDNGKKDGYQTGLIDISGADTKVVAKAGIIGAAGIGGGDDAYGCDIRISGVGGGADAKGSVTATGSGMAAGIGGGTHKSFGTIDISDSVVMATGIQGAGIGGGAGTDKNHVNGGAISLKNSGVVAISVVGGAGIGGGKFGRADKIDISGGTTMANGGTAPVIGEMSAMMMSLMGEIMRQYGFVEQLKHIEDNVCPSGQLGALVAGTVGGMVKTLMTKLFGTKMPDIDFGTGAGIGGGYKESGGVITIADDAAVNAAAGILPPSLNQKEYSFGACGIGSGKDCGTTTNLKIYDSALVTTAKGRLQHTTYDDSAKAWNNTCHRSDIQSSSANEAMGRMLDHSTQMTIVTPERDVTAGCVVFQENGGTGVMDDQIFEIGQPQALKGCEFKREGSVFVGWNTRADGKGESYEAGQEITVAGHKTLYAQWDSTHYADFGYHVTLGSNFDIHMSVKNLAFDADKYEVTYTFGGETHTEKLTSREANDILVASAKATQLGDEVQVSVTCDGKKIQSSSYSIKAYCDAMIARADKIESSSPVKASADQIADICKAALDYGSYAQRTFGYKTEELANGGQDYFDNASIVIPEEGAIGEVTGQCPGYNKVTCSMELKSQTTLRIKMERALDVDDSKYRVEVRNGGKPQKIVERKDGFEIHIREIAPYELDKDYQVSVTSPSGETLSVRVNPLCYLRKCVEKGEIPELSRALYNYHLKTKECVKTIRR